MAGPLATRRAYTPHYAFPSPGTIAFEADEVTDGMAIKAPAGRGGRPGGSRQRSRALAVLLPSSVGMITTWAADDRPNLMPCGSTTVLSRHPLVITPCVGYAAINER